MMFRCLKRPNIGLRWEIQAKNQGSIIFCNKKTNEEDGVAYAIGKC